MSIALKTNPVSGQGVSDANLLVLDGIVTVKENPRNYLTENAVVKGTARTDYIRKYPLLVSIQSILSPDTNTLSSIVPNFRGLLSGGRFIEIVKSKLDTLVSSADPLKFIWDFGSIPYCAILDLSYEYQNETSNSLIVNMTLKEIIITGTQLSGQSNASGQHDNVKDI